MENGKQIEPPIIDDEINESASNTNDQLIVVSRVLGDSTSNISGCIDKNILYQMELLRVLKLVEEGLQKNQILLHQFASISHRLGTKERTSTEKDDSKYTFTYRTNVPYFSHALRVNKFQGRKSYNIQLSKNWSESECEKLRRAVDTYVQTREFSNLRVMGGRASGTEASTDSRGRELELEYRGVEGYNTHHEGRNSPINWDELAVRYFPGRYGADCMLKWKELVDTPSWTEQEEDQLLSFIRQRKGWEWEEIASELGGRHEPFDCFVHYVRSDDFKRLRREARTAWTPVEDILLAQVVGYVGENWTKVAKFFFGKSKAACETRWEKKVNPMLKKGRWSDEEDFRLILAFKVYGEHWQLVQKQLPGRTNIQCRERWLNVLSPEYNKKPWSEGEDEELLKLVDEFGTGKWATIAHRIRKRTDNQCSRRWKQLTFRNSKGRNEDVMLAKLIKLSLMSRKLPGRRYETPGLVSLQASTVALIGHFHEFCIALRRFSEDTTAVSSSQGTEVGFAQQAVLKDANEYFSRITIPEMFAFWEHWLRKEGLDGLVVTDGKENAISVRNGPIEGDLEEKIDRFSNTPHFQLLSTKYRELLMHLKRNSTFSDA